MRFALNEIAAKFHIDKVSSVYKVSRKAESLGGLRDIKKEESLDGLSLVVKIAADTSAQSTLNRLSDIERKLQKEVLSKSVSLNLLDYDQQVVMLPTLSLPHPEFHLRPEEVVSAVELWPDYIHPVLNQTLLELSRKFVDQSWGEFFTQGSKLLESATPALDF